jgi:hypothetical protein
MEKLTAEIVRSLVKELETIPDVRIKVHYYLNVGRARELIRKMTGSKRTTYDHENLPCVVISHNPQNIVNEIPVVATLDTLEVSYGKPKAGFTIHSDGIAILGYNTNKYTDEVMKILEKYKIQHRFDLSKE